jgi:hypothetical protein
MATGLCDWSWEEKLLFYDDLDIYQFIQDCIASIEQQDELSLIKLMLAQLRATMRDASFHGYEPARYSYGIVLSMLEDSALTWQHQHRMAVVRVREMLPVAVAELRVRLLFPGRWATGGMDKPGLASISTMVFVRRKPTILIMASFGSMYVAVVGQSTMSTRTAL